MQILIIGASGYIGKNLFHSFSKDGNFVLGTQCKGHNRSLLFYDMCIDSIKSIDKRFETNKPRYAILCAANTSIKDCYKNFRYTYEKNVVATQRLIEDLYQLKYHTIFLSTDSVFDGKKGFYRETDKPNPINEYGNMKLMVEDYILKNVENSCILRLPKIISNTIDDKNLFNQWYKLASKDKSINCVKDNIFSPLVMEDLKNCILLALKNKLTGIYHLSGNKSFQRKELCELFFSFFDLNPMIFEREIEEFNFEYNWPLRTNLINEKFCERTDYQFQDVKNTIIEFKKNIMKKDIEAI